MPSASVNGVDITYETHGDGPPLLLIMGLGAQLIDWPDGFVERLVQRFGVVALDNRDAGLSTEMSGPALTPQAYFRSVVTRNKPDSAYQLADMAADAVGLLDALDIEAAHVVGASMGGMIAQSMAIDHPRRVASLTSIMSNSGDGRRGGTSARLMVKLARRPELTMENAVDEGIEMYKLVAGPIWDHAEVEKLMRASVARSFRPEGTARQLAAMKASPDRTEALGRVAAPTLVIHGMVDPLVVPSGGMATAAAVPDSRLLMFPDMGHDLPRTRWDEMVDAIAANAARAGTARAQQIGVRPVLH